MRSLGVVVVLIFGLFGIATAALGDWRAETALPLEESAFQTGSVGPNPPANYISYDFPFAAFDHTRVELEARAGTKLATRGEAHITVVTPPEFQKLVKVLAPGIVRTTIAAEIHPATPDVKAHCVGQGTHKNDQTWFVVVESSSLKRAREALAKLFIAGGGAAADFNAGEFYPHVTLGFVNRDLHLQDGVVKDLTSCKFPLDRSHRSARY